MMRTQWIFGLVGLVIASVAGVLEMSATRSNINLDLEPVRITRQEPEPRPLTITRQESELWPAWTDRIALVDRAIEQADLYRAIFEWHEAYGAALGSRRWDAMAAMGDRAVRISEIAGDGARFRAEARRAYLNALFRARAQRSADGVNRVADAFERFGDIEAARQARRLAEELS